MAKKMSNGCGCEGSVHGGKVVMGLVVLVLGFMLMWPKGWFTFEHTVGLMVVLVGLKKLWHGFSGHHCC